METDRPAHLPVVAVRFARPTVRLGECAEFYRDHLGLRVVAEFRDHDGYDGVVFGLPGRSVQLELTRHAGDAPVPEPSPENQLVIYLSGAETGGEAGSRAVADLGNRLRSYGHEPVVPHNPYWTRRGALAFTDPDGWLVILVP